MNAPLEVRNSDRGQDKVKGDKQGIGESKGKYGNLSMKMRPVQEGDHTKAVVAPGNSGRMIDRGGVVMINGGS